MKLLSPKVHAHAVIILGIVLAASLFGRWLANDYPSWSAALRLFFQLLISYGIALVLRAVIRLGQNMESITKDFALMRGILIRDANERRKSIKEVEQRAEAIQKALTLQTASDARRQDQIIEALDRGQQTQIVRDALTDDQETAKACDVEELKGIATHTKTVAENTQKIVKETHSAIVNGHAGPTKDRE